MSKLTIVLRVGLITILLVTSTVLLISNYDFPTYAAGGMLGVCLFTLLFPFIYVFLNKEARRNIFKAVVVVATIGGAIACGVSIVCGIAVGAATGAAMYTAANAGTKQFTAKGLASATGMCALGGAAGGVGGKLLGAVANRTGGVYIARQGARAYCHPLDIINTQSILERANLLI